MASNLGDIKIGHCTRRYGAYDTESPLNVLEYDDAQLWLSSDNEVIKSRSWGLILVSRASKLDSRQCLFSDKDVIKC